MFSNRALNQFAVASRLLVRSLLVVAGSMLVTTSMAQAPITNTINFAQQIYRFPESGLAIITLTRDGPGLTNASSVSYAMTDGTAFDLVDYINRSGTVTFGPGQTLTTFPVQLLDNPFVDGDRTVNLFIHTPIDADIGPTNTATLIIEDDDFVVSPSFAGAVQFSRPGYIVSLGENFTYVETPLSESGAVLSVIRVGGNRGRILVDYYATNYVSWDTNAPPTRYNGISGTLVFDEYQMNTNLVVPVLGFFPPYTTNNFANRFQFRDTVQFVLTNPRPAPGEDPTRIQPTLGNPSRSTLTMQDNSLGFNFRRAKYRIDEWPGALDLATRQSTASIRVKKSQPLNQACSVEYRINWRPPVNEWNTFALEAGSDYASPDNDPDHTPDYVQVGSGTLDWPADDATDRFIDIPIVDDNLVEFNEDLIIEFTNPQGGGDPHPAGIGNQGSAIVTILADDTEGWFFDTSTNAFGFFGGEQPSGAVDRTWNPDFHTLTDPPFNSQPGANNTVHAVVSQPDGKLILGGDFTKVNTRDRNRIARLNADGQLDRSFNPGTGADGGVAALALQPDGSVIMGGGFTSVNGIQRYSIARLLPSGALDTSFNPGLGANGPIRAVSLLNDGKILVGGDFTSFNGTNRNYIAQLHPNGTLDTSFDPGIGPNGPVNSIAVHSGPLFIDRSASGGAAEDRFTVDTGSNQGTLTIDYDFLIVPDTLRVYYGGQLIYDSGLVNGFATVTIPYGPGPSTSLEIVMNEGVGIFGTIWYYNLFIDPLVDAKPVIGGAFTSVSGQPRNYVARLNLDGSIDPTFNPGTGADNVVHAVAKQGNKVLIGGAFEFVDERSRNHIARLNTDGALDLGYDPGSGFDDDVFSIFVERNGRALVGGLFSTFNETRRVGIARLYMDGKLDTTFMDTAYNQFAGLINHAEFEQENFVRSIDLYRMTNLFTVPMPSLDTNGAVVTNIVLTNIVFDRIFIGGDFKRVGGGYASGTAFSREAIRNRNHVAALIGGETPGPGNIEFTQPDYAIDEDAGFAYVQLSRNNGNLGVVNSEFSTVEPPPGPGVAIAGGDYLPTADLPTWDTWWSLNRMITDAIMGPNNDSFYVSPETGNAFRARTGLDDVIVPIIDDTSLEGDEVFNMELHTPDSFVYLGGMPIPLGTALGRSKAKLTISDNDFNFGTLGFRDAIYTVTEEGAFATITVTREGGSVGPVSIDYTMNNGTATTQDYTVVRGTLTFAAGQTTNTFTIPIRDDVISELDETVNLFLFNPAGFPSDVPFEQRLDPNRSTATLVIVDNDFAPGRINFSAATYTVAEDEPFVTVFVQRLGGNLGDVSVQFQTQDGTALAGVDYVSTNGVLRWSDRDTSVRSFRVPIIANDIIESDKTFNVVLTNPTVQGSSDTNALGFQRTATIRIVNEDAPGSFAFSQPNYFVDENGGSIAITVLRQNGVSGTNLVSFTVTNLTASAGVDFQAVSGTLEFGPGETSKSFIVPIIDDTIVEGDQLIALTLTNASPGSILVGSSTITILDNELARIPAGLLDTTFNSALGTDDFIYSVTLQPNDQILIGGDFDFMNNVIRHGIGRYNEDGSLDRVFDPGEGVNGPVRSMVVQPNGRILIGGFFTTVNNTNRNYIARLNIDGSIDPTFNPGAGADNPIYDIALQPNERIIIVGDFGTYNGVTRNSIARLQTNGVLDASFDIGTGANGAIFTVALQNDGKVLIGGDFTTFNGVPRNRIARLNANGSVDLTFDPGAGANGSVRAINIQSDGRIAVGGLFTSISGQPRNRVARLLANGSFDSSFNPGTGANGPVNTIALQADGKWVIGGDFTEYNGIFRGRIARLNLDGSLDATINFGAGLNATVSEIVIQPDRKILVVGGFTQYDGQVRNRIARIHGGSLAGAGSVEFVSSSFRISETGTNATVTVRRVGGLTGQATVQFVARPATASSPADFQASTNVITFRQAETHRTITIPIFDDALIEDDEIANLELLNPTDGLTLGPQPTAALIIESDDAVIEFSAAEYSVTENFVTGSASITVRRRGATSLPASVTFYTLNGTATAGTDYVGVTNVISFNPGETSRTFAVGVIDDTVVEGTETVLLRLANLTGKGVLGLANATLSILDDDRAPGKLEFTSAVYSAVESGGNIVVTVRRIEGTTGVVSVDYATQGATAQPRSDYTDVVGIVSFGDGENLKSFTIPIFDDFEVEGNEDITVTISNPRGGATIAGSNTARATIVDDDLGPGSVDSTFNPGTGANAAIRAAKIDPNSRIVIGGEFTSYNETNRSRVARLTGNGSLDLTFDPGVGPNNYVADLDLDPAGKILISGQFTTVNGVIHNRVARLDDAGNLDPTFNLPLGLNAEVSEVVRQPDGKILIGGVFNTASAAGRNRIARLNADGTVDLSFDPGTAADNTVHAITLQPDGKILVGGAFVNFNGVGYRGIVRLNSNGSIDTTFNIGFGVNGPVRDILLQPDGRIVIAGDFSAVNAVARMRVARLNANGTLDTTFATGAGVNGPVYSLALQRDNKIFIGGDFTTVDGVRRVRVARLNTNGSLDPLFNPGDGPNALVHQVLLQPNDQKVIVVGAFTMVDSSPYRGIARFNNDRQFIPVTEPINLTQVERSGNSIRFSIATQVGFTYSVEASTDLQNWSTVRTITASGPVTEFTELLSEPNRFYRVRRIAP